MLYGETLKIQRRVLGPEHPDTLVSMNNLALMNLALGKYAQAEALCSQAEALFSQTLENSRRVLGPEIPPPLPSSAALHSCTNNKANTLSRRLMPHTP